MDRQDLTDGGVALSLAQERWWFLEQLTPGLPIAHLPTALRLRGTLNQHVLERSLSALVQRHAVLRATFTARDGQPAQAISPFREVRLPVLDVVGLPPDEQARAVQRLVSEEARRPFDLSHGPLLRASLLRLAAQEQLLLVTLHRLAADAQPGLDVGNGVTFEFGDASHYGFLSLTVGGGAISGSYTSVKPGTMPDGSDAQITAGADTFTTGHAG